MYTYPIYTMGVTIWCIYSHRFCSSVLPVLCCVPQCTVCVLLSHSQSGDESPPHVKKRHYEPPEESEEDKHLGLVPLEPGREGGGRERGGREGGEEREGGGGQLPVYNTLAEFLFHAYVVQCCVLDLHVYTCTCVRVHCGCIVAKCHVYSGEHKEHAPACTVVL